MIKTEYRGYEIYFSEQSETWVCSSLDLTNSSYAKLREQVDAYVRASNRVDNVKLIAVSYGNSSLVDAIAIKDGEVICRFHNARVGGRQRAHIKPEYLVMATKENIAITEQAARLLQQSEQMKKDASALIAKLPRITLADLKSVGKEE